MNHGKMCSATLVLALFLLVGCQDVQPDSTLGAALAQTDMSGAEETSAENEMTLDLRLEALQQSRPDVRLQARNPFRFGSASAVDNNDRESAPLPVSPDPPRMNPPIVPQARLRMIGLVEAALAAARIAVLTDGDVVLHGQVGDVVDGRYRIIDMTSTSVEIESISDGSRQVLRLAGS
jgi:hypothetical protein